MVVVFIVFGICGEDEIVIFGSFEGVKFFVYYGDWIEVWIVYDG